MLLKGKDWREKVAQLQALPKFFYTPTDEVTRAFASLRGEAERFDIGDELWDEIREHVRRDPVAYIWHLCFHKNRDTRRLEIAHPSPGQTAILWRFSVLVAAGIPVRLDLLKERQGGFTWLFTNLSGWVIFFNEHLNGLQSAHDDITSKRIFMYLREAHEWLPKTLRPAKEYSGRKELVLREKEEERLLGNVGMDSGILVQTAAAPELGTGQPIQLFHASEIGKWKGDPVNTYTSVVNAIQDEPFTFIFREGTAHGFGSFWHVEWGASLNIGKEGWNGHTPIFLAWYVDPRNKRKAPPEMVLGKSDDDEFGNEEQLVKLFDLDNDQLEWRRRTIIKQPESGGSKVDKFKQEHPSTDEEAWLHAHGKWLSPTTVGELRIRLDDEHLKPLFTGYCDPRPELDIELKYLRDGESENDWLTKHIGGPLRIWRLPDGRSDYIAGCDVAEGHADGDASCIKIYQRVGYPKEDYAKMRIAAEWYGLCDEDRCALLLWRLGWFYSIGKGGNRLPAMLCWERTGPGRGIAKWIKVGVQTQYPASRMYRRNEASDPRFRKEPSFGISTNAATKPVMLGEWRKCTRDGDIQLTEEDIDEAETLTRNEHGRVDTNGRDRFMASCMAIYGAQYTPLMQPPKEESPEELHPHSVKYMMALYEREKNRFVSDHETMYVGGYDD